MIVKKGEWESKRKKQNNFY